MKFSTVTAIVFAATLLVSAVGGQEAGLPGKFIKECKYFVWDWATEVEIEGKVYRGTWTVRWSPDKACIVSHYEADTPAGPLSGTRIEGWDTSTDKLLVVDFGKDGSSSVERYTIVSDRIDEGEIAGVDAEGKRFEATARTDRMEENRFTWTVTKDGKPTVYKFNRVKK